MNKKNTIKNKVKIFARFLGYVLLFLFLISIIFSIPGVQTRLAKTLTNKLKESYDTNLHITRVDLSFLGSVQLKGVELRDHHNDTLIFVKNLSTSLLNAKKIVDNKVNLGSVSLDGVDFHLKTYKGEDNDNLSIFVESFDDDTPKDSLSQPFLLNSSNMYIDQLNFKLINENKEKKNQFSVKNGGGSLSDFKILGPDVTAKIRGLYFVDDRGIEITNLTTDFTYTKTHMLFHNTVLETKTSKLNAHIVFDYKREDLQFFNDKVEIKAKFKKSRISLLDLSKLYGEFGTTDVLNLKGNLTGTLNDFKVDSLDVLSDEGFVIKGDLKFKNAIDTEKGFSFNGNLKNVTANYDELKSVLPGLLGKTLPTEFKRLGDFTLKGTTFINEDELDLDVVINSRIGTTKADLKLTNIASIDNASYEGNVELIDFNIGEFFKDPYFGEITLNGDVNGTGFRIDNVNTGIIGVIKEVEFNGYNYKSLNVNGLFQKRLFNGNLNVNDEFFKMRFNGLADFSSKINKFNFTANITEADLVKTNLFLRDSLSKIKGELELDIVGNSFDNILGTTKFKNIEYTNQKQTYNFKQFVVVSKVKDTLINNIKTPIKTININNNSDANGIAQGYIKGNFKFSELIPLTQNALGSVYANYNPYKVAPNQTIEYDFNVYNQIVDVFFPDVYIDENTNLKGLIDTKRNIFKLHLKSPKVVAYGNVLDSINLIVNTQNKAYNTHLRMAKINTAYFNATKLNLINRTKNDTLFVKSEFKGDNNPEETFNMDFFYTFNEEKKSVLGIQKSTFNFEENTWRINPKDNKDNKVVFDIKKNEFNFSPFNLKSKEQEISFKGVLKDSTYKDLKIDFVNVNLSSFLPPIDSLSMNGVLSGNLDFIQKEGKYSPKGNLFVKGFKINSFEQGDLELDMKAKDSYEKYKVELTLENAGSKSIYAKGFVDFTDVSPTLGLSVAIDKFQLNAFSPLGKDVLSKIRGEASTVKDSIKVTGTLRNPVMAGELELKDAGLKFPYLNVDYDFEGTTKIKLEKQSFIFEKLNLLDTKHNTRGDFSGAISHENFKFWFMDLNIITDNLIVLDTEQTEESLYYGTAFIKGSADIVGLTESLSIEVNAKTNPNTKFVIPLRDVKTIDNYKLIRFKSNEEVALKNKIEDEFVLNALKGLELKINLEVTNDAIAEVVIDENLLTGRGNGNLEIEIDTRNNFSMKGGFTVEEGKYEFKYGGLVNKTFNVVEGGTISWNGSPYDADLNITAVYTTNANPSVLLENFNSSRKIPVNLITKITGGLFSSKQELDIKIPNVNNTITSELEFILNDNNKGERMKQFISLLVLNTFNNPNQSNFDGSTALLGTTSNAITNVISDLISSNDGKVQFNVNYDIANRSNVDNIVNDDLVNVEVGTQISDRVVVNGKVGVPVGSKTQSSVVGEVKVEVLLNEKGNFRGVIFNRQNEIQYSTEEEGYTQGVGLTYQVNFNNLSELLQKIGLKKTSKSKKKAKKDSVKTAKISNFIKIKSTKNKD